MVALPSFRPRRTSVQQFGVTTAAAGVTVAAAADIAAGMGLDLGSAWSLQQHRQERQHDMIQIGSDYCDANAAEVKKSMEEKRKRGEDPNLVIGGDGAYPIRSRKHITHVSDSVNVSFQAVNYGGKPLAIATVAINTTCPTYKRHRANGTLDSSTRFKRHKKNCTACKSTYSGKRGKLEAGATEVASSQLIARELKPDQALADLDAGCRLAMQKKFSSAIGQKTCANHDDSRLLSALLNQAKLFGISNQMREMRKIQDGVRAAEYANLHDARGMASAIHNVIDHLLCGSQHMQCSADWCEYAKARQAGDNKAMQDYRPKRGFLEVTDPIHIAGFKKIVKDRYTLSACTALTGRLKNNGVESQWCTQLKYLQGQRICGTRGLILEAAGGASVAQKTSPESWKKKMFIHGGVQVKHRRFEF